MALVHRNTLWYVSLIRLKTVCNNADVNCLLYNPSKKQALSEKNKPIQLFYLFYI